MAGHRVTAAAVVVPIGGTERYLYRGSRIPASVPEGTVQRLVRRHLISAIPDPAPAPAPVVEPDTPAGGGPEQPEPEPAPVVEPDTPAGGGPEQPEPEPAAPARGRR